MFLPPSLQFSPTAGPTAGGTNVTVVGIDLGSSVSDIQFVQIGVVFCSIINGSYVPGARYLLY